MTCAFRTILMICAVGALTSGAEAQSRVLKLDELSAPQIDALDRARTMFILPLGMVEEHGPHLPVGADTLAVMFEAQGAATRVSRSLPDWTLVMMPPISYGQGGANIIANLLVHPGTYGIRQSTLRALVADLGSQIAQNRFKWIFVMNGHGGPTHNIAINEACDFVSETFGVTMLHLTALFRADPAIQTKGESMRARFYSTGELSSFGLDVHAGVGETAGMLAVRPDLVLPAYKTLPSQAGGTFDQLTKLASAPGWQGYFSSPAKATPAYGRGLEDWWIEGFSELILRAVRGENMFAHPRNPDRLEPAVAPLLERALESERAFELKLEAWLAQRKRD